MSDAYSAAVDQINSAITAIVAEPVLRVETDPLERLKSSIEVADYATTLIAAAVDGARAAGCTWQEIGEAFGITRQAAFQRFGKPIDPRTGEVMSTTPLAEASVLAGAVIDALAGRRWDEVVEQFDGPMRSALTAESLSAAWAQVAGLAGAYERRRATDVVRAADITVTNTTLDFEAGTFIARISFRDDLTIAGLYLLPDESGSAS
ncbi:MAG: DUF3887 domain-containing protein [Pseudolysinimonas sp.]